MAENCRKKKFRGTSDVIRRNTLELMLTVWLAGYAFGADGSKTAPATAPKGPKVGCFESVYDFGKLANTNTVTHSFFIENEGDAPLTINRVRVQCGGCTVSRVSTNTVQPGDWTEITTAYSLHGRAGRLTATLYVETSDPANRIFELKLTGEALPTEDWLKQKPPGIEVLVSAESRQVLRVEPGSVAFGTITNGMSRTNTLSVVGPADRQTKVLHAYSALAGLSAAVRTVEEGRKYAVDVVAKPELAVGTVNSSLKLVVKDYKIRYVDVPVTGVVVQK
ncbi:MAG: hypothetical protein C0404_01380 [Verrucomicrobia bacterium]|nr:hypothetical protein [Verrucomicrobiota bacterium]